MPNSFPYLPLLLFVFSQWHHQWLGCLRKNLEVILVSFSFLTLYTQSVNKLSQFSLTNLIESMCFSCHHPGLCCLIITPLDFHHCIGLPATSLAPIQSIPHRELRITFLTHRSDDDTPSFKIFYGCVLTQDQLQLLSMGYRHSDSRSLTPQRHLGQTGFLLIF